MRYTMSAPTSSDDCATAPTRNASITTLTVVSGLKNGASGVAISRSRCHNFPMVGGWRPGQVASTVEDSARVRGRRYGDWDATLADLRRRGDSDAYMPLLQECISATERESCA